MKKTILLLLFAIFNTAFSQNGKVYLKNKKFNVGKPNTYVYEPPQGLVIEDNSKANVLYATTADFDTNLSPLIKKGKLYEFTAQVPDSVRTILVTVTDLQKVADNNQDKGYSVLLKTQNESELSKSLANEIFSRSYGNFQLKLKLDTKTESTIPAYEALFAKYPKLKEDKIYLIYLYQKGTVDKEFSKKENIAFAAKCVQKNTNESLTSAYYIYENNGMTDEKEKIAKELESKYPNGQLAESKFIQDFYSHPDKTESYILETLNTFKTRFKNTSKRALSPFYKNLHDIYLQNKELEKAIALEPHLYIVGDLYNNYAWTISGAGLKSTGKDIDFAAIVSKRSLDLLDQRRKESYFPDYEDELSMYTDTYAHILYKQGKYDEAYKYQHALKEKNRLDLNGKETYLAIIDKIKSKEEVKAYIEDEINTKGVTSTVFLAKLKEIYIEKNLPIAEYNAIEQKTNLAEKENNAKKIISKFGSDIASDFSLKNLEGKEIKLSDYRGKVVVLDFWATWCGPCKASFPKMQGLVEKYKDKDVQFLFVNTWEKGKNEEIYNNVSKFISEKKYTFNVLLDDKAQVVENYKIDGIPTRIVIDKTGKILVSDYSNTDIAVIIDEQLK
ncbi:TlpA disulfide reductase family protein [Flavobacterium ustbae]|uniref:TlpA disulfide reductase family protein n=1 Tax=Flavobacterium ustbae TaxID=2488790 RepID=UPI000F795A75|nr:TlpA disulfide reductase family protein [Flavobacterium ustbae]